MMIIQPVICPVMILRVGELSDDGCCGEGGGTGDVESGGAVVDNEGGKVDVVLVDGHSSGLVRNLTGFSNPNAPSMQKLRFACST